MALHLWAGWRGWEVIATPETMESRSLSCFECEHWDFDTTQCKKCGCLVMAKTMLALEKCPVKRWGREWRRKRPVVGCRRK
jgi:hypothetical protein